jgi:hypothetical protein
MALILDGNGLIQGLDAGGLPSGSVNADTLASTLDLSSKTMTFGNVSASGITFPASVSASSNANTLDDYEEGTWTPVDGSGAGLTLTTGASNAFYVKIGSLVLASFRVLYPSTADGSTQAIGGLPFTVLSTSNTPVFGGALAETSDTTHVLAGVAITTLFFIAYGTGSRRTNAQCSGKDYRGIVVYRAA